MTLSLQCHYAHTQVIPSTMFTPTHVYSLPMHTKNWLKWRYATKKFDATKEVSADDLEYILEAGAVDGYKDMMVGDLTNRTEADRLVWAQKQAYIALGTMMIAAAEKGIDNAPMEGFNPAGFNEILGLSAHNLHATVILAIGYRSTEDETQNYAKVRKNLDDIVVRI